jgi:CheY-like chemotaxis protein
VDDDVRILQAFERQFRKEFEIQTALGPVLALQAITSDGPFAVVVSDLRIPEMDGIEFLARVRQMSPDTVRVMLSGNADLSAAIAAVNEGKVFQFLTKPCPHDMLARTLESALEQHRLITIERELLENTLRGTIGVMTEILSLVNPAAFSRAQRIRRYVHHMAEKLKLADPWQFELAAMLSQVGFVTVPTQILEKSHFGEPLDAAEQKILASQTRIAHDLLVKIPRLEKIAEMIAHEGWGWTERRGNADPVETGAHLLKIALDLDEQVMRGNSLESVISQMHRSRDYNPSFVVALRELQIEEAHSETELVSLSELQPKMIINSAIYSKTGLLLLARGQEITESAIARLKSFASLFGIVEPISVIVHQAPQTNRIPETAVA